MTCRQPSFSLVGGGNEAGATPPPKSIWDAESLRIASEQ
jgi:hypothetical protein